MKRLITSLALMLSSLPATAQDMSNGAAHFYKSDKVTVRKVTCKNQYQMSVTGNLFVPDDMNRSVKNPAIIVGHPMGAVKEQSANLYAAKMAERGFVTLSMDFSFWGESEGLPRNAVSPDIYAEDFSAAVDFLGTRPFVDRERIGVIAICGSPPKLTTHPTLTSSVKFMNLYPFEDIETISPAPCSSSRERRPIPESSAKTPTSEPPSRRSCLSFQEPATSISTTGRS